MIELRRLGRAGNQLQIYSSACLPCVVGRGKDSAIQVCEPGVFEKHAVFRLEEGQLVRVQSENAAIIHLNGERVTDAIIRSGDILDIGGAKLLFGFSPPVQKNLKPREVVTWALFGLVLLVELIVLSAAW